MPNDTRNLKPSKSPAAARSEVDNMDPRLLLDPKAALKRKAGKGEGE